MPVDVDCVVSISVRPACRLVVIVGVEGEEEVKSKKEEAVIGKSQAACVRSPHLLLV